MIFFELKGSAGTELVMAWLKTKGFLTCGQVSDIHMDIAEVEMEDYLQPPWTRLFRRSHGWDG